MKSVRIRADFKTDEEWRNVGCVLQLGDSVMEQNRKLKPTSQTLRKNAAKEENLLWYNFLRLYKPQFRRQYVIGDYIVDFYCHKAKLVVELDGSQHYEPKAIEHDRARSAYLESQGVYVLRISNVDVLRRFANVCEYIDNIVKSRNPAS